MLAICQQITGKAAQAGATLYQPCCQCVGNNHGRTARVRTTTVEEREHLGRKVETKTTRSPTGDFLIGKEL